MNGAPCPAKWRSWSGPWQAQLTFGGRMLHLVAQDVSAGTCQGPFTLVPTTTSPHFPPHPSLLLQHFIPSCKPLGLIAAVVLGEAVKAEPQGDNKASGEEISKDQTESGSHPMLDSQRSLCSCSLLVQCCSAFKGCRRDSGAHGQPCHSPWPLSCHLCGPAIKKENSFQSQH